MDTHRSYLLHPRCTEEREKLGDCQHIHMVSLTHGIKTIVAGRAKRSFRQFTKKGNNLS